MPVTIRDVARESGVNVSTVSRSLNGTYGVHQETRERVLAVAARLNYRPNRVARGLATGRSHTLGLIVSDIRNPFFAEVARGAEDGARAQGSDLVLCNSDLDPDKQMQYVQSLLDKRVDGILMNSVAILTREQQDQLAATGVPIVLLNRASYQENFSTVCADNEMGGCLAGEYLLQLGHRQIGHISGPPRIGNLTDRADGLARALRSAPDARMTIQHGENSFQGAYESARALMAAQPQLTALFAASDVLAFGVIRALTELGLRIPADVSLIGFDNVDFATAMIPPLTTIHQPKHEIGREAAEVLLRLAAANGKGEPEHRTLPVRLMERQSCRPL